MRTEKKMDHTDATREAEIGGGSVKKTTNTI